jgi:3-hydroxyisobutyrate dehydrogenase
MTIGFAGLGNLGAAIARRMIAQGLELELWNRTPGRAPDLTAPRSVTPRELAAASDTIVVNLFDSDAVAAVLGGESGVLEGLRPGATVIDTTTNDPRRAAEFHRTVGKAGGRYLEAPVLGSVVPASQGALTALVSGDAAAFEKNRPVLESFAKTIFFLEKPGLASRMKLVNNLVLGGFMAVLAEALWLGERSGVDAGRVLEILASGAGNSTVLNGKRPRLVEHDYAPHFSCAAIAKDLRYAQAMAEGDGLAVRTGAAPLAAFEEAIRNGFGEEDLCAVYKVFAASGR